MGMTMIADFSDKAYAALMSGDAVDDNGLRSKKGNYYPDLLSFRPKLTAKEKLQQYGVNLVADVAYYLKMGFVKGDFTQKMKSPLQAGSC